MRLNVECAAGPEGDRPVRFSTDGRAIDIAEVVDVWPGEGYAYFKVTDAARNLYILRREEGRDAWDLVMYERAGIAPKPTRGDGPG